MRQGCGGACILNMQQVIEKVSIRQASVLLKLNVDPENVATQSGHFCASCTYKLSEEDSEIFDGLPDLDFFIQDDVKMTLVYIAGYVSRNDEVLNENELLGHTAFYFHKYGRYTKFLDRGGLKLPSNRACQWVFFCFIMFHSVKNFVCRKSLTNVFWLVTEFYEFGMNEHHCITLSNIFLNKLCIKTTPRSGKEPAIKVLKLS